MPETRLITGTVYNQDGSVRPNATMTLILTKVYFDDGGVVLPIDEEDTVLADANGEFSVRVYTRADYIWRSKVDEGSSLYNQQILHVPAGTTDVSIGVLTTDNSVSEDTGLQLVFDYVDQKITEAALGGGAVAANVLVTPTGQIAATEVQAALAELDAEKLATTYELPIDPVLLFNNALV